MPFYKSTINYTNCFFPILVFLFLLSPVPSFSYESDSFVEPFYSINDATFKCPHTTSQLKRKICGIEDKDSEGVTEITIFSRCPSNEICTKTEVNGDLMTCVKRIKLLKEGKKCMFNKECGTQYCQDKKCTAKENGFLCSNDAECGKGNGCSNKKCVPLTKEVNGSCGDDKKCGFGMLCNENKCIKFGTLDDGESTKDEILCKSGMSLNDKCVSVKNGGSCPSAGGSVSIEFNDGSHNVDCKKIGSEGKSYHNYYELKSTLFKNYLEEFNKVDLESIYNSDDFDVKNDKASFGKWKIKEKFLVYKYTGYLKIMDIIDNEGEVKGVKECEYDFLIKQAGDSRTRVTIFTLFTILLIIFL